MIEKIIIYRGSSKDFENFIADENVNEDTNVNFMELVQFYNLMLRQNDTSTREYFIQGKESFDTCIVKKDDYGSVLEHVILNFSNIIELNTDIETLYLHNPPKRAEMSLKSKYSHLIEYKYSDYEIFNKVDLLPIYNSFSLQIKGQEFCKREIINNIYKHITLEENKPLVLLFYGPSGVGKTESAKCLSKQLNGELLRIQFSMMQNSDALDYVFGSSHARNSLAKDLEARESNIILIDEFDKVHPNFYNAFYEMFDEGKFSDPNYVIDLSKCIFILTTNFESISDIQKSLGLPIFSRIGAIIKFDYLDNDAKKEIVTNYYAEIVAKLNDEEKKIVSSSDIFEWFLLNVESFNNARLLKTKVENAIFNLLTDKVIFAKEDKLLN